MIALNGAGIDEHKAEDKRKDENEPTHLDNSKLRWEKRRWESECG
jgi:hypothetical protein